MEDGLKSHFPLLLFSFRGLFISFLRVISRFFFFFSCFFFFLWGLFIFFIFIFLKWKFSRTPPVPLFFFYFCFFVSVLNAKGSVLTLHDRRAGIGSAMPGK